MLVDDNTVVDTDNKVAKEAKWLLKADGNRSEIERQTDSHYDVRYIKMAVYSLH